MYTFHKQKRGQKAENRPRRSSPKNMMRSPPKNRFKGVNLKDFYASNFSRFNHKKTRSSFTTSRLLFRRRHPSPAEPGSIGKSQTPNL